MKVRKDEQPKSWQFTTSYGEILKMRPCAAGLRTFVHSVGGLSEAKKMKRFNVGFIKHVDSVDHMQWVMNKNRVAYSAQFLVELAWDLSAKDPDVMKARIKAANRLLGGGRPPRRKKENE